MVKSKMVKEKTKSVKVADKQIATSEMLETVKAVDKANLDNKKISTGALPDTSPKNIDEILGRRWFMYDEKTDAEYQSKLEKMNFSDLQRHAIEVGNIIPNVDKRDTLINRLVKIYLERKFKFVAAQAKQTPQIKMTEELSAILRRGK